MDESRKQAVGAGLKPAPTAYDDWQKQLEGVHAARAKERYDRERARLLGLSDVMD